MRISIVFYHSRSKLEMPSQFKKNQTSFQQKKLVVLLVELNDLFVHALKILIGDIFLPDSALIQIRNAQPIENQTSLQKKFVSNVVELDYLFVHALKILIGKKMVV